MPRNPNLVTLRQTPFCNESFRNRKKTDVVRMRTSFFSIFHLLDLIILFYIKLILCMIVAKGGKISFGSIGTCTGFHQNFVFCVWQQPRPVQCASCDASGSKDCVWCKGTGFFFLGDQMLCEVPSRNTLCVICGGKV
jgi:hypothetical protein